MFKTSFLFIVRSQTETLMSIVPGRIFLVTVSLRVELMIVFRIDVLSKTDSDIHIHLKNNITFRKTVIRGDSLNKRKRP